jgi:hypothetical protein
MIDDIPEQTWDPGDERNVDGPTVADEVFSAQVCPPVQEKHDFEHAAISWSWDPQHADHHQNRQSFLNH